MARTYPQQFEPWSQLVTPLYNFAVKDSTIDVHKDTIAKSSHPRSTYEVNRIAFISTLIAIDNAMMLD